MPTRLIVSAPTGKTNACIDEIRVVLGKYPLAKIRVIVTDRLQAAYFRRRLSMMADQSVYTLEHSTTLYKNILENLADTFLLPRMRSCIALFRMWWIQPHWFIMQPCELSGVHSCLARCLC
ncbi:hypothetical protein [Candidatus Villigracilis affinis]|uniref:hypothetical protein n=1 Tax=Candidatus Villigracilis affinis TaxID=3140682 RepID=UPI002A236C2E|nr:hypothetical protein [Anaerolineales bacterium]